jgi:hypothetical protein
LLIMLVLTWILVCKYSSSCDCVFKEILKSRKQIYKFNVKRHNFEVVSVRMIGQHLFESTYEKGSCDNYLMEQHIFM